MEYHSAPSGGALHDKVVELSGQPADSKITHETLTDGRTFSVLKIGSVDVTQIALDVGYIVPVPTPVP
jgi:hypothetical protein